MDDCNFGSHVCSTGMQQRIKQKGKCRLVAQQLNWRKRQGDELNIERVNTVEGGDGGGFCIRPGNVGSEG